MNKRSNCVAWAILLMGVGASGMCSAQKKPKEPRQQSAAAESGSHTTILPGSQGGTFFFSKGTQYWTPAAADIARLEEDLPNLAGKSPAPRSRNGEAPRSILTYYRQYIGIIENGRRCIYINAFRGPSGTEFADWQRHAVKVYDGGDSFYHTTYDVKARRFDALHYNGYA